uniref:Uncharacterized protein n=1 Tax=Siphoviridae sp. ctTIi48 TaxID=2827875 RepID=A0A8S5TLB8_9CAUD|nr:MAG TPA: hypothetical protein [Siphoviridae sp. ctTIi48]
MSSFQLFSTLPLFARCSFFSLPFTAFVNYVAIFFYL